MSNPVVVRKDGSTIATTFFTKHCRDGIVGLRRLLRVTKACRWRTTNNMIASLLRDHKGACRCSGSSQKDYRSSPARHLRRYRTDIVVVVVVVTNKDLVNVTNFTVFYERSRKRHSFVQNERHTHIVT